MKKKVTTIIIIIQTILGMFFFNFNFLLSDDSIAGSEIINGTSTIDEMRKSQILNNLNKFDGFLTKNCGQIGNSSVEYYIQGKGIWFLDDGVMFEIMESMESGGRESGGRESIESLNRQYPEFEPERPQLSKSWVLRLTFEGCNAVEPKGSRLLPHRSNFFYGNDSSKWYTEVPNFQEIIYENLYDNIDLKYYNSGKGLKYDFIVYPGGDPTHIKLNYIGAEKLSKDTFGNIKIQTELIEIIDSDLFIYQSINSRQQKIQGAFLLLDSNTYGFKINAEYDKDTTLIIDPLIFSTFIGGSNGDWGDDIAVDAIGDVYVTGSTQSPDFPITTGVQDNSHNGAYDIFTLKLDSTGSTLIYSTFVGGAGSDGSMKVSFAIDQVGNSYVTSDTKSADFPIIPGAFDESFNGQDDVFVFKLNPSGSTLIYSTFIGGSQYDRSNGIEVDPGGNIHVTGYTHSTDFPVTLGANDTDFNGGFYDCYVFKLNAAGSGLLFSTFIGGSDSDFGIGLSIIASGDIYLTGETASPDFPVTPDAYQKIKQSSGDDAFVLILNSTGTSIMYSTFIGGTGHEWGHDIAIDANCDVYVTGHTSSIDFPITQGAYDTTINGHDDCIVFKLDIKNSSLIFSTYIGGNTHDWGRSIAIDSSGNICIAGVTYSNDFPTTHGAFDMTYNGGSDIFISMLNSTGVLLMYSTFIGGADWEFCRSLELDISGYAYIAGSTRSPEFPNTTGSNDTTYNGNDDAIIMKLELKNCPYVLDLNISKTSVKRNDRIYLYGNGSDEEDSEELLIPFFEHRAPNNLYWKSTYFSNPQYKNSRWQIEFTPSINAALGLYDFRVRFNNTINLTGNWYYIFDVLTVLNNLPIIENLKFSNASAIYGDKISVWINGADVEEPEQNLTVNLEYKDPDDKIWNTSYLNMPIYSVDRWEYILSIPFNAFFGYYDFRARFNDSDDGYTTWIYVNDSFLIYNIKPNVIDIKLSDSSINRTEPVFIYVNGTDHETPESNLKFTIQYKPQNEQNWTDLTGEYSNNNWKIEFLTSKNSKLGFYDFRVMFEDKDHNSSGWQYLNHSLEVLNNVPKIQYLLNSKPIVFRTKSAIIYANGTDIETPGDQLICEIQYKSQSGDWKDLEDENFIFNQWEVNFTPAKGAELGFYDLRANFWDADGNYSGWTAIENAIEVKNNLPIISNSCDNFEVNISQLNIDLTPFGTDIEDPAEDLIWSIDQTSIDTTLFTASIGNISMSVLNIVPVKNVTGSDNIALILTDNDGGYVIKSDITIIINSTIIPVPTYRVNISVSPELIEVEQAQAQNVILTVTNEGNIWDIYNIGFISDEFAIIDIGFSKSVLSLEAGNETEIDVIITIPTNMEIGKYKIKFIVKSNMTSDNATLTIYVNQKSEQDKPSQEKPKEDSSILFIWIAMSVIIILVIVLILFFIFLLRKKPQEEPSEPVRLTLEPIEIQSRPHRQLKSPPHPKVSTEKISQPIPRPRASKAGRSKRVEEVSEDEIEE